VDFLKSRLFSSSCLIVLLAMSNTVLYLIRGLLQQVGKSDTHYSCPKGKWCDIFHSSPVEF
jgi:ABC-type sugar transport system ATPase subunit